MKTKYLEELMPGETAIIHQLIQNGGSETNLMEMGLTEGTPIRMVKFAPLGDPVELKVRGYHLSIRRSEAKTIVVEQD